MESRRLYQLDFYTDNGQSTKRAKMCPSLLPPCGASRGDETSKTGVPDKTSNPRGEVEDSLHDPLFVVPGDELHDGIFGRERNG